MLLDKHLTIIKKTISSPHVYRLHMFHPELSSIITAVPLDIDREVRLDSTTIANHLISIPTNAYT